MTHRRFAGWFAVFSCAATVLITPVSGSELERPEPRSSTSRSIVVTTATELLAALAAGTDRTIFMRSGTYVINEAIHIPDHTALIGEGTMVYNDSGLPAGFIPESRTVIAAAPGVIGDLVSLGTGASLHGLVIQDVARPTDAGGVVVMVASQGPGVSVWASIVECEIVSPNPGGATDRGPTGRGLSVFTRNGVSGGGITHERSMVSVRLTHSIIRSQSPGGADGIFALNNASRSHIYLHLQQNVMGRLTANGGTSRPDSTTGASVFILSTGNRYRADTTTAPTGWVFNGGVDAPIAGQIAQETMNNRLWMYSYGDRIEGFGRAITATAGLRMNAAAGAISSNSVDLILYNTRLACTGASASGPVGDLQLFGARTVTAAGDVAPGNGNELRVTMANVIGSGRRPNEYGDAATLMGIGKNLGTGNRLVVTGSPNAFSRSNKEILPMPGVRFFRSRR